MIAWTGAELEGRRPQLELHITRRPVLTGGVLQEGELGRLRRELTQAEEAFRRFPSHHREIAALSARADLERALARGEENAPGQQGVPDTGAREGTRPNSKITPAPEGSNSEWNGVQLARIAPKALAELRYPVIAEAKLDGLRAILMKLDGRWVCRSRHGKPLYNVQHILDALAREPELDGYVLDGELTAGDFTEALKYCRSSKKIYGKAATVVRLRIFDIVPRAEWEARRFWSSQQDRKLLLERLFGTPESPVLASVDPVAWAVVEDEAGLSALYGRLLLEGHEGMMIKDPRARYGFGRQAGWLKHKPVMTDEFPIVGFVEGEGRLEENLGAVIVEFEGKKTRVGTGFSDRQRARIWKHRHQLVGFFLEVGFQEVASQGGLRFPRFKSLRTSRGGEHVLV